MAEFANKVAIITGASSGIGHVAAVLFAQRGAKVVLVARSKDKLAEVQKQCAQASKPENVLVVAADVTNLEDLKRIVSETVKLFGKIDILVNNAGQGTMHSIQTSTVEDYDYIMNLNVKAPFFLIQYAAPHLAETKGCIVNVSSIVSLRGYAAFSSYSMAKAALDQLTRSAAAEFGAKGIRVNTVNPGIIETNFANALGTPQDSLMIQQFAKQYSEKAPVHRVGKSEDIAECILFLASSKASFVDGINLIADGGHTSVA